MCVKLVAEIKNVEMMSENFKEICLYENKTKTRKYIEKYIRLVISVVKSRFSEFSSNTLLGFQCYSTVV
jgi:hypothetical protein